MQQCVKKVLRRMIVAITLLVIVSFSSAFTIAQPGWADSSSQSLSSEEKLERAYDAFNQDAGMREEIYQRKAESGDDSTDMPSGMKRIKSLDGKDVPKTSFVESVVSKAKELVNNTNDDD